MGGRLGVQLVQKVHKAIQRCHGRGEGVARHTAVAYKGEKEKIEKRAVLAGI
jgi:hypothetical protein